MARFVAGLLACTAFDVFVTCETPDGKKGFIAIEVKYTETMTEPPATLRPRYDELSQGVGVFKAHDAQALRANPLQQLWREHLLSLAMINNGLYDQGRFVVIYPAQNNNCDAAVTSYWKHLVDSSASGFEPLTLERCLATLAEIGGGVASTLLGFRASRAGDLWVICTGIGR